MEQADDRMKEEREKTYLLLLQSRAMSQSVSGALVAYISDRQTDTQFQAKLEELTGHAATSQNSGWQTLSETHDLSHLQPCSLPTMADTMLLS